MTQRRRSTQRLERLVHHATLGRALERLLALEQRGESLCENHDPLDLLGGSGGPTHAPQQARQQRPEREAERRAVISADPATQLDQRRAERGLGVGRGRDRLCRNAGRGDVDRYDEADHLPSLHRHHHARPRHDALDEGGRHFVGVGAGNRDREDDLDIARLQPRLGTYG